SNQAKLVARTHLSLNFQEVRSKPLLIWCRCAVRSRSVVECAAVTGIVGSDGRIPRQPVRSWSASAPRRRATAAPSSVAASLPSAAPPTSPPPPPPPQPAFAVPHTPPTPAPAAPGSAAAPAPPRGLRVADTAD